MSLIEGDGIGPEIAAATVRAVEAAGGKLAWERVDAGAGAVDKHKDPLPPATIASIQRNQLALKGPLATPSGGGYRSVNVTLRQQFDLYANVRPVRTIAGVPSRYTNVDLVIVRENTEDLYAGVEHYIDPRRTAAESIAIITKFGSERIITYAFEYARRHGRKKVTLVHKANILKMSNGLFLDTGREIAQRYPDIAFDDMIVDATAMKLVIAPERFDVIVTMNLFGDILSDLTAGLVGGLGVAPAANIGAVDADTATAMFEAVHGTAPDIAGKGIANPTGLMLSAAMLLDHVDQRDAATRLRKGIYAALANPETRTGDLGGKANTAQYTDAVIRLMA
ncbi:MAG TPA: isocitrate/isopropylmalate dehydrogenase family protein [Kofleriaceae bacterium]|nr:isocitrate/isopropylmalate dehydrogenase family protein [Kofleriaceae bacterium]